MTESAWAAARTRTRPGARFRPLARRFGRDNTSKAAVAVAHTLICIAWAVMSQDQDYTDAGEDYYEQRDQRNREHLIRHHQQALAGSATRSPSPALATAARRRHAHPAASAPGQAA